MTAKPLAAFAASLFGDPITPAFAAAIALVIAGLALVNWRGRL